MKTILAGLVPRLFAILFFLAFLSPLSASIVNEGDGYIKARVMLADDSYDAVTQAKLSARNELASYFMPKAIEQLVSYVDTKTGQDGEDYRSEYAKMEWSIPSFGFIESSSFSDGYCTVVAPKDYDRTLFLYLKECLDRAVYALQADRLARDERMANALIEGAPQALNDLFVKAAYLVYEYEQGRIAPDPDARTAVEMVSLLDLDDPLLAAYMVVAGEQVASASEAVKNTVMSAAMARYLFLQL